MSALSTMTALSGQVSFIDFITVIVKFLTEKPNPFAYNVLLPFVLHWDFPSALGGIGSNFIGLAGSGLERRRCGRRHSGLLGKESRSR